MTPTLVLEADLADPLKDHASADHAQAKVLVRLHGTPLGFLELPLTDGVLTGSAILAAATAELPVADHLTLDGIVKPSGKKARWACQAAGPEPVPGTVSIVLCTRDRAASLRLALTSVLAAVRPGDEVVVVDNAPKTQDTRTVVAELADPRLRYLLELRPGLSVARNTGARATTGEIIAFTDDDVVVDAH